MFSDNRRKPAPRRFSRLTFEQLDARELLSVSQLGFQHAELSAAGIAQLASLDSTTADLTSMLTADIAREHIVSKQPPEQITLQYPPDEASAAEILGDVQLVQFQWHHSFDDAFSALVLPHLSLTSPTKTNTDSLLTDPLVAQSSDPAGLGDSPSFVQGPIADSLRRDLSTVQAEGRSDPPGLVAVETSYRLAVGDFNADGFDDLAIRVASALQQGLAGSHQATRVFVGLGSEANEPHAALIIAQSQNASPDALPSQQLIVARDFDGDAFDDLFINVGQNANGTGVVFFGSKQGLTETNLAAAAWLEDSKINGHESTHWSRSVDFVFDASQSPRMLLPTIHDVDDSSSASTAYRSPEEIRAREVAEFDPRHRDLAALRRDDDRSYHQAAKAHDLPGRLTEAPSEQDEAIELDPLLSVLPTTSTVGATVAAAPLAPKQNPLDDEIGALIAQRDETGLHHLLLRHGGRVKAFLRGRYPSLNEEDVDEALIEGAFKVWRYFAPARETSVGAFFVTTAKSAAIDIMRSDARRPRFNLLPHLMDAQADHVSVPAERQSDLREAITTAIGKLTAFERAIIRADWDSGGKAGNKELAVAFGVSSSAVTHARSTAYAKLRTLLADFDPTLDS